MKHSSPLSLIPLLAVAICLAAPAVQGETKTATVSPGKTEVVEFDGDPSGLYQLNIQATSGHTINDSDFTAEFKSNTLWQRQSKTSYNITYTENPNPPGVSVEGDFERSGGGGGEGYSPNFFLVNVPNVDCEPEETRMLARNMASQFAGSNVRLDPSSSGAKILTLAGMRTYAYWKDKEYDCAFEIGICQNVKLNAHIRYSDNSSIGVSTNQYILDGGYPYHGNETPGTASAEKFVFIYDQPAVSISSAGELQFVTELSYTLEAECFYMVIPEQGPPVSKMVATWSSSGTATLVNGELELTSHSSSPSKSEVTKSGSASDRPPVSQGEIANIYGNKYWQKLTGGANSRADQYIVNYNTQ